MAEHSEGFKWMIVNEHLEDRLGYRRLAEKHGMPDTTPIRRWGQAYRAFGKERLRKKQKKEVYPAQFKLDVLHFMKQTGACYQDEQPRINWELEPPVSEPRRSPPGRADERTASHIPEGDLLRQCGDGELPWVLKQEMYYGKELVSYEELKQRIKQKLAGMNPIQYRIHASQSAA